MALIASKAAKRRKPPFLPDEVLQKLKCNECSGYLSTPPIYKHLEGHSICGECATFPDNSLIRNSEYEAIAAFVEFPCKNKNCHQRIPFGKCAEHEYNCPFRQYDCPSCAWQGGARELGCHFALEHRDTYLEGVSFYPEMRRNTEMYFLYLMDNEMFVIQTKCIVLQCRFWCLVRYVGKPSVSGLFKFKLEFRGDRTKQTWFSEEGLVQSDLCWIMDPSCALEINISELLRELKCPLQLKCKVHITHI